MRSELHDIPVQLIHETEKAWLVNDGTKEAWVPKSIAEMEQNRDGTWTLTAPQSILKQKGFL